MATYQITDLIIAMNPKYPTLKAQSQAYLVSEKEPDNADITLSITQDFLAQCQQENPHLSMEDCEYIWLGAQFYHQLISHQGILLHSSALEYQGKAYLFSASSGTGKSTHTSFWQKQFGEENIHIINDDKPALRIQGNQVFAYGTPFSGKTDLNQNIKVPVQGICFLERGIENKIWSIHSREAILPLMNQTLRPDDSSNMNQFLDILDTILRNVSVYRMKCNMSTEAAEVAWQGMR